MGGFLDNINLTKSVSVSKTFSGTGATTVNLFQLTGTVKVNKLYGILTAKTTLANMTATYFALYDGTATNAITKNDGIFSTGIVGGVIAKAAASSVTASINLAATGTIIDLAAGNYYPFLATQKSTVNTFISFLYTTTDNPIAATMVFYVEYEQVGGAGTLVAV